MNGQVFISGAVEGPTDEAVLRRVIEHAGGIVHRMDVRHGKSNILRALPGINQAARRHAWVALVDLDTSHPCPGALVAEWLPAPAPFMRLRVAVRCLEAWLLADAERFAAPFSVPLSSIATEPEHLDDPKATVVALARRSRKRAMREDMIPRDGSGRRIGAAYTSRLMEFATRHGGWRPDEAARRAPSLHRCITRVRELVRP